jgi:hypothetical protein
MKIEKTVHALVLVVIGVLIAQIFLAITVLMICGNPNSRIGIIASISSLAPGIILGFFLGKLFELFTGRNFGEMYCRFYSFDKHKHSEENNEISQKNIKKIRNLQRD